MRWRALGALGTLVLATVLSGCRDRWGSELVSVDEAGTDAGNGMSPDGVLSSDGTKVAFATLGSDFGPRDTNGNADVYVRDLATGVTTLVSVNGAGTDSSDHVSSTPVFSPDATKVAFSSHASNLGPTDTHVGKDVYIRDLSTGTTSLVSANADGSDSGNLASEPYAYVNGKVLFSSGASDLGPNDTNGQLDLYLASVVPHA